MTDDLKARLRETWCGRSGMHDRHKINPDGPEAADRIEQLEAEIALLKLGVQAKEAMYDSMYQAGVKAGWKLCAHDDEQGYQKVMESTEHIAELKRLKVARAALAGGGDE